MTTDYNQRLEKIEEHIYRILPRKAEKEWIQRIAGINKDAFADTFGEYVSGINIPALDLVERGGKRWRPMLMLLFCEMKCGSHEKALSLTPVVELAHNGSLIIDDIEDSSEYRRGKPAIHLIHGTDMAINSANFLYFLPLVLIEESGLAEAEKAAVYRFYCRAMTNLHTGQGLDIQWHRNHSIVPDEEEYLQMCLFKTGSLSRFAAEAGITVAGGTCDEAEAAGRACAMMGAGFQILDDVINLTSGNPGKKRGDDIVEGKKSLPVILFRKGGGNMAELEKCFMQASALGIEKGAMAVEKAVSMLEESGAIEAARVRALSILDESKRIIGEKFSDSVPRRLLFGIFDSFCDSVKK